jgi:hypothetical protein
MSNETILVDINLPNVEYGEAAESAQLRAQKPCVAVGVHPFIEPLISQLAIKHPEWRFVVDNMSVMRDEDTCKAVITSFDVFEKREKLGVIGKEYSYGRRHNMYTIENFRTSEALTRASHVKTSDTKKAIKLVEKYFKPINPSEKMTKLVDEAYSAIHRQSTAKRKEQARHGRIINEDSERFLNTHRDELKKFIPNEQTRTHVDEYFTVKSEIQILDDMQNNMLNPRMLKVMQHENTYYFKNGGELRAHTAEELPEDIRHKLGILKLVDDGQAVEEIGFRHNTEMFILYREQP